MGSDDRSKRLEKLNKLTPKEQEILSHFCEGKEYKQIAEDLGFAEPTIRKNMSEIRFKLGITSTKPAEQRAQLFKKYCSLIEEDQASGDAKMPDQLEAADPTSPHHIYYANKQEGYKKLVPFQTGYDK